MSRLIYLADTALTNIPTGKRRPPRGEPWEFHLFVHRGSPKGPRDVVTIRGRTKAERDAKVVAYTERRNVRLLPPGVE
jgi:hypothetical protein